MSDVRSSVPSIGADAPPNTTANALVGAVVTVLTAAAVPLAPLLGGGLAGYLEAGGTDDGLRAGVLAGGVAAPVLLIAVFLTLFPMLLAVGDLSEPATIGIVVVVGTVYVLGLSTVGGYLGAAVGAE